MFLGLRLILHRFLLVVRYVNKTVETNPETVRGKKYRKDGKTYNLHKVCPFGKQHSRSGYSKEILA